jgi:hypothetical protein
VAGDASSVTLKAYRLGEVHEKSVVFAGIG